MPPSSATMASRRVGAGDAGMGSGGPNVEKDVVGSKQHASSPLPSSSVAPSSQMSVPDLLRHFGVSPDDGLSSDQVLERRERYGWNELTKEEGTPLYRLILDQFDDVLVKILLAAAVVSFALAFFDGGGDDGLMAYVEPMVILIILILNAIVGVWQESNAEAALEALKDLQPEHARVVRDGGHVSTVASRDLVPGDVVEVRVGDRVPADLRLLRLRTTTLRVDQAQLTGESQSVEKDVELLPPENDNGNNGGTRQDDDVIQAKTNMLFATTVVVGGMGRGLVVSTGMSTEIGTIQRSVQDASTEDDSTPLKKKLDEFGDWLSKVILVICALVWVINYKNFFDPIHGNVLRGCIYYFKIAVALAVAAIPEGLPTVITTCLALGTRKMAKRGAIVRKLPSVETLGCTSVICSDKTGTLTTNEMSCVEVVLPAAEAGGGGGIEAARVYEVEGITYSPVGTIDPEPRFLTAKEKSADGKSKTCQVSMLSYICSMCNSASLEYDDQRGTVQRVGEPTEASLKVLVEKIGLPDRDAHRDLVAEREVDPNGTVHRVNDYWSSRGTVYSTLEFSRDRKSMSVLVKYNDHVDAAAGRFHTWAHNQLLVKGAPESVLERCTKILLSNGAVVPLTDEARAAWLKEHVERMAGTRALRCLAVAYRACSGPLGAYDGTRDHPARRMLSGSASNFADLESDLVFVGLVGMLDPPRDEIAPMIEMCKTAGIRVIMITGDNKLTAEAIARKVGILDDPEDADETTIAMTEKASPPLRTKLPRSLTGAQFFGLPEDEQLRILSGTTGGLVFSRTEPKHKQQMVKLLKKRLGCVVAMTGDGVNDAPALKQADIGIAMGITGTEVAKEASDMVLSDDNFATIVSAVEEGRAIYDNMQAFIRYLISSNIGEVAAIFFTAALGLPEGLIPVQLLWVNLVTDGPPATALGFNPADSDIMKKPPRRADDSLITNWVFFRYMVVGIYVGVACVGAFAYWYMYHEDEHTLITWHQLTHWAQCHDWEDFRVADFDGLDLQTDPCKYFTEGKVTASTLSLSVLVTIEMLNALNALSEDGSLLTMPPWANPYLVIAMFVSFGMHFLILYVDVLATTFSVTPLDFKEWMIVLAFSVPVILIDEVLKLVGRRLHAQELDRRLAKSAKNVSLDVGKKNQ